MLRKLHVLVTKFLSPGGGGRSMAECPAGRITAALVGREAAKSLLLGCTATAALRSMKKSSTKVTEAEAERVPIRVLFLQLSLLLGNWMWRISSEAGAFCKYLVAYHRASCQQFKVFQNTSLVLCVNQCK